MPDEDFSVGAFGDRTRELHAGLTSQGLEVSPAEQQRGFFGPATLAAVRALQQANGLTVTGVVDAATLAALSAPAPAAAAPVPAATATAPAATATALSSAGGGEQPPSGTLGGGGGSGDGGSARGAGTIVLEHGSPA
ncbi:MAG TPA: peptidoglycan-binding domain-containing protein, partial [Gemmatimonadales bacterium]|nr:peptidoglycan-binding domain-containing protein [Gemmatimonadales bacterium]